RQVARIEHVVDRTIVGVHELDAIAPRRERVARDRERVGIAIDADEARSAAGEQRTRVAAEADRAIDEDAAAPRLQLLEDLGGEHRFVRQMPNSESAFASSSVYASRCILVRNRSWFQTSRKLYCPSTSTSPFIVADSRRRTGMTTRP